MDLTPDRLRRCPDRVRHSRSQVWGSRRCDRTPRTCPARLTGVSSVEAWPPSRPRTGRVLRRGVVRGPALTRPLRTQPRGSSARPVPRRAGGDPRRLLPVPFFLVPPPPRCRPRFRFPRQRHRPSGGPPRSGRRTREVPVNGGARARVARRITRGGRGGGMAQPARLPRPYAAARRDRRRPHRRPPSEPPAHRHPPRPSTAGAGRRNVAGPRPGGMGVGARHGERQCVRQV